MRLIVRRRPRFLRPAWLANQRLALCWTVPATLAIRRIMGAW